MTAPPRLLPIHPPPPPPRPHPAAPSPHPPTTPSAATHDAAHTTHAAHGGTQEGTHSGTTHSGTPCDERYYTYGECRTSVERDLGVIISGCGAQRDLGATWPPDAESCGALTVTTQPGRKKSSDCRIRTSSEVSFGMHAREPV